MRSHRIVGLDFDGEYLYAAEMALLREGPLLRSLWRIKADDANALSSGMFGDAAHGAAALPRLGALEHRLNLPVLSEDDTKSAILTAIRDQLSLYKTEFCLGWRREEENREVQAIAVRRTQADAALTRFSTVGLVPARLELRPCAAATCFWFGHEQELDAGMHLLIELRAEECSLILIRQGKVLLSRALPGLGTDGLKGRPAFIRELLITFSLLYAQPDWQDPSSIWLSGPCALQPGLKGEITSVLGIPPDVCQAVMPRNLPRLVMVPEPGPEMLVPIGLCLAGLGVSVMGPDLLPGLAKRGSGGHSPWAWAVPLGLGLLFALSGVFLLGGNSSMEAESQSAWLARHEKEIKELKSLKQDAEDMRGRLQTLTGYGDNGRGYLELLLALDQPLPVGTAVKRISLSGDKVEVLEGSTPSITVLLRALKETKILSGLGQQGQATTNTGDGAENESFTLTGYLGGGGSK